MKQILLAIVLIAVPVALFTGYEIYRLTKAEASQSLGDLSDFKTIVKDVQTIAATGNFVAAEKRATDFETEWDDKQKTLRPLNPQAWGNIDDAADALFKSLRHGTPTAATVNKALADLQASLDNSGLGNSGANTAQKGAPATVEGIAVTDASGHPIPCEDLIGKLKSASAKSGLSPDKKAKAEDLLSKALERCNADDDQHADAFSAKGLAVANQ